MKELLVIIAILFKHIVFGQRITWVSDAVELINPLMSIGSKFEMSNGNSHPAIALHRGMHFWVPQTGRMGTGWLYIYNVDKSTVLNRHINPHPG